MKGHTDIQPGDIFLWRIEGGPGHVGVVKEYDNNEVTVIEALTKSAEESPGLPQNCVRESHYSRTGKALSGHTGWKGYFRPIIKY